MDAGATDEQRLGESSCRGLTARPHTPRPGAARPGPRAPCRDRSDRIRNMKYTDRDTAQYDRDGTTQSGERHGTKITFHPDPETFKNVLGSASRSCRRSCARSMMRARARGRAALASSSDGSRALRPAQRSRRTDGKSDVECGAGAILACPQRDLQRFRSADSRAQIVRGFTEIRWLVQACDVLLCAAMVGRTVLPDRSEPHRPVHILARTIFRELRTQGYPLSHLIDLAGELLDAACDSIRSERGGDPAHREPPAPGA